MNLISLEEYSKINEAVIGLRNIVTIEEFKQLEENERKNIIKLLLLNSGDGTGLFENSNAVNHVLIDAGYITETDNIFESINESLNEDWDDDVSGAIIATGAGAVAGAASLAAYINFLFKKKKIKKAWDQVATLQKDKSDIDVDDYEKKEELKVTKEKDLETLEPELSPEEYKEEKEKISKEKIALEDKLKSEKDKLENFDKNWETELAKAKESVLKAKRKLYQLDSAGFEDPDSPEAVEKREKAEAASKEKTEKGDAPKGDAPKGDEGKGDAPKGDAPKGDAPKGDEEEKTKDNQSTKQPKGKSLNEEDKKDDKKDDGPKGELQKAQEPLDKLPSEEEARKKAGEGKGNEAAGKLKKEREKLQQAVNSVKDKISRQQTNVKAAEDEKAKYTDPAEGKKKLKEEISKIREEIEKGIPAKREEAKEKAQPDPAMAERKSEVKDRYKDDVSSLETKTKEAKEDITKEIEAATQNADNMSGTAEGGAKSSTLTNKALGFSKKYANQVKADNDADVAKHVKKNRSLMDMDTSDLDAKQKAAAERSKQAEKELKSSTDSVDASDEDKAEAEDKVAQKEKENKAEENNKKKEALEAKIENTQEKIDAIQDRLSKKGIEATKIDPKKEQDKLDRYSDLNKKFKEQLSKIGESFALKLQVAMLESEVNEMFESYGLILEATRRELIPEEEEKKEKAKDDVEKDKKKIDNLKGSKDKKSETDDDGDGVKDPADVAKEIKDKSEKEDESNPLIGKKVVLKNMRDKDLGQLEKATGKVIKSFAEGEREPEGDLPRRAGEPEVYKIKFDKPKDPMYPEINLTKDNFEEAPEKEEKKEKTEESVYARYFNAINEALRLPQLEELKKLQQKVYDSKESGAIDLWEDYAKRVIGVDGDWSKAPEGSWPKAIKELENICTKYSIK